MLATRVASVASPINDLEPPSKKQRLEFECTTQLMDTSEMDSKQKQTQNVLLSSKLIEAKSKPNLYMDVMHSILQFLQFDELATASQLNSQWKVAVKTLKPQRNGCVVLGKFPKPSMISWPTAKYRRSAVLPHVTHVNIDAWAGLDPSSQCELLRPFTRLQAIVRMEILNRPHLQRFKLPHTLTSLSLNVSVWALQELINACSQVKTLRTLHIRDVKDYQSYLDAQEQAELGEEPVEDIPQISFKPLSRTLLEDLAFQIEHFETDNTNDLLADLMAVVSDMSTLLRLNIGDISTSEINHLIHKPHQLQRLQEIYCNNEFLEPELLQILGCHYPTLTDFPGFSKVRNLDDCSLLLKLPSLRQLRMEFRHSLSMSIPPIHQLMDNVRQLQLLEIMEMAHPLVTNDHLAELCKHLPVLKSLLLKCCLSLTELAFLHTSPLSKTLTALHLHHCTNIPSIELFQLKALSKLEELHVIGSFNEPLCRFALVYFEPHSPLCIIPTLREFLYDNNNQLVL